MTLLNHAAILFRELKEVYFNYLLVMQYGCFTVWYLTILLFYVYNIYY
jgi:hypothetical protein